MRIIAASPGETLYPKVQPLVVPGLGIRLREYRPPIVHQVEPRRVESLGGELAGLVARVRAPYAARREPLQVRRLLGARHRGVYVTDHQRQQVHEPEPTEPPPQFLAHEPMPAEKSLLARRRGPQSRARPGS